MAKINWRHILLSLIKFSLLLVVCVLANLAGTIASQLTKSILFVDLTGTAIASLVYGPLHGAIVGLTSNFLGEFLVGPWLHQYFTVNLDHYALFGPVHMAAALVWSVLPRLLRGRLATDLFCDSEDDYPCGKILLGILVLALVSNFLSASVISLIIVSYSPTLGCPSTIEPAIDARGDVVLCNLVDIMYGGRPTTEFEWFWKVWLAKTIIGYPDHVISLSAAVLLVAFVFDGRRYKMGGVFGRTLVTNRPAVATIYILLFAFATGYFIRHSYVAHGASATFGPLMVFFVFVTTFLALNLTDRFELWRFTEDHKKELYAHANKEMKDAYEDCMKCAVLFSVCLYFWFEWMRPRAVGSAADFFQQKLFGALGVAFLITFVRYFVLVFARLIRVSRKWLFRDHSDHDSLGPQGKPSV